MNVHKASTLMMKRCALVSTILYLIYVCDGRQNSFKFSNYEFTMCLMILSFKCVRYCSIDNGNSSFPLQNVQHIALYATMPQNVMTAHKVTT